MRQQVTAAVVPPAPSRRELFSILPAGAAACLACLGSATCAAAAQEAPPAHNWTEKSEMSWEGVFRFAYQQQFIPYMKAIAAQLGEDKLTAMLRQAADEMVRKGIGARPVPDRSMAAWSASLKTLSPVHEHALVYELLEDTPRVFAVRISKCLWAKVFRDSGAANLGYATICYPDFAVASAFNPKMKLVRTKTLMQGDDCCNHRYVMES